MKQNFKKERDDLAKNNKHQVKLYKKYHDYLKKNRYQSEEKHRKSANSKEKTNEKPNSIGEEETDGTTVIIKFDKDSKENVNVD